MRPLSTAGSLARRRLGGVGELLPLGQAAHHVLQLGADEGVAALALPAGGISEGGLCRRRAGLRWRGRLPLVHGQVRERELKVGVGGGVRQRAAGLRRGVCGHGGQLSSVTTRELLLLRLIPGRRLGCWVSPALLRGRGPTQARHRPGVAPTGGGAGQARGTCGFLPGGLRGRAEAVVSVARESASADR